jgi:hypothetical protein
MPREAVAFEVQIAVGGAPDSATRFGKRDELLFVVDGDTEVGHDGFTFQ